MKLNNQIQIAKEPTKNKKLSKTKKMTNSLVVITVAILISQGVMAATPASGNFLHGVYNEIVDWLTGTASIIISIFIFGFSAFQGIMKQNYSICTYTFLIALLFANAQVAIDYFQTALAGIL